MLNSHKKSLSRVCFLLVPVAAVAASYAQPAEEVQAAKQIFEGKILGNQITVRSGPSENYYPVVRLDSGALVVVNGIKFDWLRIAPPEGTFSLIAKQYVDVSGTTGKVKAESVNVRAGSLFSTQHATVQTKVYRGDTVTVLGEMDTPDGVFLKIKPPPGAFFFVKKDYVAPVRVIGNAPEEPAVRPRVPSGGGVSEPRSVPGATTRLSPTTRRTRPEGNGAGTTGGSTGGAAYGGGVAADGGAFGVSPTTRGATDVAPVSPVEMTRRDKAEQEYSDAEQAWADARSKPIEDQPLPELLAKFEALSGNEDLPVTLRQQARSTAAFLKSRNEAREEVLNLKKQQAEMAERLQPLKEQNRQLQDKFRQIDMTTFNAAGTLQNTTLQQAGHVLLRLVDPATTHTLIYIKGSDASLLGQFVGVKGTIAHDDALNIDVLTPTTMVIVDPNSMGKTVTAEIMPPSMRPAAGAVTGGAVTPPTPGAVTTQPANP